MIFGEEPLGKEGFNKGRHYTFRATFTQRVLRGVIHGSLGHLKNKKIFFQ